MSAQSPSREEIDALPRWARVAYAARCARRVLPIFQRYAETHRRLGDLKAVRNAIEVAEGATADAFSVAARAAADAAL
jgi:hypothetical protein